MEELEESVPQSTKFSIGYFEGQTKRWICNDADLAVLYEVYAKCPNKEILLWCDGRKSNSGTFDAGNTPKRKKPNENTKTRREEKEERVAALAEELGEMHEGKYNFSELQYRLWARMIVHGNHVSKEIPPQVPLLQGIPQKKAKSNPFEETMMNTATAVMKAISNNHDQGVIRSTQIQNIAEPIGTGISPGKAVDIRGRSLQQLATLKQLYVDGVLSQDEFDEQKDIILSGLKKLN